MIADLYSVALDCEISPEIFWNSSLEELRDRIESFRRVRVRKAREKISLCYELAGLIGTYVGKLFDDKNAITIPHPWDAYPELFSTEKKQFEETQREKQLEAVREMRHVYAERHNRIRKETGIY